MTAPHGRGLLHLAAAVDQRGSFDAAAYVEPARLAERGALDFVTLGGAFAHPGPDTLGVLARVAPATRRIGLVPTVSGTRTESCHVHEAVATLDWISRGRAGWQSGGPTDEYEDAYDAYEDEDEARFRADGEGDAGAGTGVGAGDGVTGGFGGRDGPHRVDFRGSTFSVTGPSIEPRPPQGHPVRVVDATGSSTRRTAARYADVALLRVTGPAQARALRAELRDAAAESGRAPGTLRVLGALTVDLGDGERAAEPGHGGGGPRHTPQGPLYRGGPVGLAELIAVWHESEAVDGFHLTPVEPRRDLERLVNGTVALLQHRGLFRTFYPGSTLREHLRLARPAGRYAVTGGAS
ncbi:LLM class flavin-dependent oxidoreductase [Streptomyces sp. NBC_01571]|uniref:LLM class flavin-dependent oxidoreductase n=1 Tax=Streptomyces sp. NBC_01571 TaxID=2975883 RepID=UPI0022561C2C|nr:LLM class flavin-dependent oxidoreductase [Streptomyces sp. NBC_01571]MCX4574011.1 LLM class flavin-dependent oxidoreductase [Streptomyces sp. NBC_01571]